MQKESTDDAEASKQSHISYILHSVITSRKQHATRLMEAITNQISNNITPSFLSCSYNNDCGSASE